MLFKKNKKTLDILKNFVKLDSLDNLLANEINFTELKDGKFQIIAISIESNEIKNIPPLISKICERATDSGGTIEMIFSSIIIIAYEIINENDGQKAKTLIQNLLNEFGVNIKIIYKSSFALVGNLGSKKRMSYTILFPQTEDLFAKFAELKNGSYIELQ